MDGAARQRIGRWIAAEAHADAVTVVDETPLSGGAIQDNRAVDLEIAGGPHGGRMAVVVRRDSPSAVAASHDRAREFALLGVAFAAGVKVAEPLWLCLDPGVLGRPFFVMRRVPGVAAGHRLVRAGALDDGARQALIGDLGAAMAAIHAIAPPHRALDFLPPPAPTPALHAVALYRGWLDDLDMAHPAIEWGLRWLERNAPPGGEVVLCHRDFRTGNYLVDGGRLGAILDWEFATWSDPLEDIGWFLAKCWRFGAWGRDAGGIGGRDAFIAAYERASGRTVERAAIAYWEVMAHVRWAVIALQQAERHISGAEDNLELALTGHVVPELELEILALTGEAA